MSRWNLAAKKEKQEHALMSLRNMILKELLLAQKIPPKEAWISYAKLGMKSQL